MVKRLVLVKLMWICLHRFTWAPGEGSEPQQAGCTRTTCRKDLSKQTRLFVHFVLPGQVSSFPSHCPATASPPQRSLYPFSVAAGSFREKVSPVITEVLSGNRSLCCALSSVSATPSHQHEAGTLAASQAHFVRRNDLRYKTNPEHKPASTRPGQARFSPRRTKP